jgi:predicted aldo/keto reductase-like oxidoreductase
MEQFERFFDSTRARLRKERLELFGIACVDDREALGENVWGRGGMIDFLLRQKADGRLGGAFCTTHGSPEYIQKLIRADVFDALMVAYNPLGSHLLSYTPSGGREFESLPGTRAEVFPLARERDVGLMIMKPLAGGLLCPGRAFPPRARLAPEGAQFRARDLLRLTLALPGVTCVVPGTASVAEAEENALAGHGSLLLAEGQSARLTSQVRLLDTALCSRCGKCESSCSRGLPVSWLSPAGYLHLFPSEIFEAEEPRDYFRVHPGPGAACETCQDRTCSCPSGLDIPQRLTQVHTLMKGLEGRGVVSPPAPPPVPAGPLAARVVIQDIPPGPFKPGEEVVVRLQLENTGQQPWQVGQPEGPRTELLVSVDGRARQRVALRQDVHPGQRGHFAFSLPVPVTAGAHRLRVDLASTGKRGEPATSTLVEKDLMIQAPPAPVPLPRRGTPVYGVAYREHNVPRQIPADTLTTLWLTLENRGTKVWRRNPRWGRPVEVGVFLDGTLTAMLKLPVAAVGPGQRVSLHWPFRSPRAGTHELKVDLAEQNVTWFEQQRVEPLVVRFEAVEARPSTTGRLVGRALETNCWFSAPTRAISWNREGGTYPIFAESARGCRITDVEGREYLDYVMGWGCALLGHAHPRVQGAIRQALDSGAILSLPHRLEMEVAGRLLRPVSGDPARQLTPGGRSRGFG